MKMLKRRHTSTFAETPYSKYVRLYNKSCTSSKQAGVYRSCRSVNTAQNATGLLLFNRL